jgi:hypothetical protein
LTPDTRSGVIPEDWRIRGHGFDVERRHAAAFGFIDTRLTASSEEGARIERDGQEIKLGIPPQMRELASTIIPLGRPGTPEEAAGRHPLPLLAVVELRERSGPDGERRADDRHDVVMINRAAVEARADFRDDVRPLVLMQNGALLLGLAE